jgi:hypothetical protein
MHITPKRDIDILVFDREGCPTTMTLCKGSRCHVVSYKPNKPPDSDMAQVTLRGGFKGSVCIEDIEKVES